MKSSRHLVLTIATLIAGIFLSAGLCLAQENKPAQDQAVSTGEPDILWLWGEVSLVDADKGTITVKYLDYETDTEKEAVIYADEKTTYENVSAIAEIKPKDIVSIDYIAGAQGSNVARNISVEKPDEVQPSGEGTTAAGQTLKPAVNATALPAEAPSADVANTTGTAAQQ